MELTNTRTVKTAGVNILLYGKSGVGKTTLVSTLPEGRTLIIDTENGLLPLKGKDYAVLHVKTEADLKEAFSYVAAKARGLYSTVVFDSLSELGEILLLSEKEKTKDPRQAYVSTEDTTFRIIKSLKNLEGFNKVFIAKEGNMQDETGCIFRAPLFPGNKASQKLPYEFDGVLAYRVVKDKEGKLHRTLQTGPDMEYQAKDRSSALLPFEAPDLAEVIRKMGGDV